MLGGTLIAHLDWRWIFFANLPLGLAAWLVMARCLRPVRAVDLDFAIGAVLLAIATVVALRLPAGP